MAVPPPPPLRALTMSVISPDFSLTLRNFHFSLTLPDHSNADYNNLVLCAFGAYHISGL